MKKILVMILTVAMIAAAFVGCAQKPSFGSSSADTNGNGLRDDVELKIMKDCYADDMGKDFDPADITVEYFGTYNGAIAVKTSRKDMSYIDVFSSETVGEFVFTYPSSNILRIYVNGKFISVFQAFDTGVLTESDLAELHSEYCKKK